jgi:hypothetical protein
VTCQSCGAELPPDAKFCPQCAAPVPVAAEEAAADEQATVVIEPEILPADVAGEVEEEAPEPEPETEPATTVVLDSPAMSAAATPRPPREPRRRLEERGTWEEFVAAVLPIVRAPRFAGNLLAALVAFAISLLAAALAWVILDRVVESTLGLLPLLDPSDDDIGAISLLGLTFHQVPMVNEDVVSSTAPLLLALVPLAACAIGLTVGRRTIPASGEVHGFLVRTAPFALMYGVLCFLWSMVGAEDWHAAHASSLFAGLVLATIGAWLAERRVREHPAAEDFEGAIPNRPRRALRAGVRVLVLLLAIAPVGWLVGTITATVETYDDDRGELIAQNVLHVAEGGFEALGFGVMAEGTPFGTVDEDDGLRVWELGEVLPDSAMWIYVIVAFATVLVGALFSGFAIARAAEPRSRNDHALYGALTGVIWAIAMLLAQQFVLIWELDGDDRMSTFDGSQTCVFSLLIGGLLGALGGMLAAGPRDAADDELAPTVTAEEPVE